MSEWRLFWLLCSFLLAQKGDSLMIYYGVLGKDKRFILQKPSSMMLDSLRRAAARGDTAALMAMVEYYQLYELRPDSSRRYLELAVKAGVVEAAYLLGVAYLRGVEAPRRPQEARRLLEQAAEKGHILSLRVLWEELEPPDSVNPLRRPVWPYDAKKAFAYAMKAAELGDPVSMGAVGRYFGQGKGVERNDSLAYVWLRRAAERGYWPAAALLAEWALERWHAPAEAKKWAARILQSEYMDIDLLYRAKVADYHADVVPRWLNYFRRKLGLGEKTWSGPAWLHSAE
jgi:TPR repeat protein